MSSDNDDKYDSSLETDDTTLRLSEADDPVAGDRIHGVITVLAGRYHGAMFMLDQEETIIGRGRGNQIYIADEGISRIHARIVRGPDAYYIRDAGSKNGTFVQGQRIDAAQRLADGDRILYRAEVSRLDYQSATEGGEDMLRNVWNRDVSS